MIEISNLTKRFGAIVAVEDLSFEVGRGRITGFVGPNGAGKTTTLRALLGLVAPTSGETAIDGRPYRELPDAHRRVGAVLEATSFHPGRSGRNHLRVVARAAGIAEGRIDHVLEVVGLRDVARRRVKTYSLGMRQRLGLATALLGEPDVLVLDEPANGLDPEGIRWLRNLLRSLASDGRSILVSSHVLAELAQTADDVAIISRGRLVAHAPLSELTARAGARSRVRSPEAERLRGVLDQAGIAAALVSEVELAADAPSERVGEVAAEHGIVLHELVAEASSLEEVFLALTGGEEAAPG